MRLNYLIQYLADLDVLRSSLYSNLMIGAKKNIHRNFEDLMLFEIGPVFKGKKPGRTINNDWCN